jgi:hypothetical protein
LCAGALALAMAGHAVVPEHAVENGVLHLDGIGPDNPILYDNDWLALVVADLVLADLVITSRGRTFKPDPALTVVAQPRGDQRDRGSADRSSPNEQEEPHHEEPA